MRGRRIMRRAEHDHLGLAGGRQLALRVGEVQRVRPRSSRSIALPTTLRPLSVIEA